MPPFFSIIIPCYNQAHFLPDCLESLLKQEFQDWEAIIVNDGSPDDTSEVAKRFTEKDSRIKLTEKKNGGLSSARNFGISQAVGERYIFLDADDFLYTYCLEKVFEVAEKSDDFDLIQYGYTYVKEDGKTVLGHSFAQKKKSLIPDIFKGNLGPCHSICISRLLLTAAGKFDEKLKSVEDWDFWIRAIKAGGEQKIISSQLVYYRYARTSMSRDPYVMYEALKTVIERALKKDSRITIDSSLNKEYNFDIKPVLREVLLRSLGVSIMQGKIKESIQFFKVMSPISWKEYTSSEFAAMCSYLTFRYWYSPEDIKEVFEIIYPNFKDFFIEAGYTKSYTDQALFYIFSHHYYYQNIYRYGKKTGAFLNFLLRQKYKFKQFL